MLMILTVSEDTGLLSLKLVSTPWLMVMSLAMQLFVFTRQNILSVSLKVLPASAIEKLSWTTQHVPCSQRARNLPTLEAMHEPNSSYGDWGSRGLPVTQTGTSLVGEAPADAGDTDGA